MLFDSCREDKFLLHCLVQSEKAICLRYCIFRDNSMKAFTARIKMVNGIISKNTEE